MQATGPHEVSFTGVRLRFESEKSFEDLLAAFLADVGHTPVPISDIAKASGDWKTYAARVERHVGPSGFMLFALVDHGEWLARAGIHRKAMRAIFGNPLIAITMLRHDVIAGLFAPVEALLLEEQDGRSSFIWIRPSSLMVIEPNPPLAAAAKELDTKLAALARKVTSSIDGARCDAVTVLRPT